MVRPPASVNRYRTGALVFSAVDQEPAKARCPYFPESDLLLARARHRRIKARRAVLGKSLYLLGSDKCGPLSIAGVWIGRGGCPLSVHREERSRGSGRTYRRARSRARYGAAASVRLLSRTSDRLGPPALRKCSCVRQQPTKIGTKRTCHPLRKRGPEAHRQTRIRDEAQLSATNALRFPRLSHPHFHNRPFREGKTGRNAHPEYRENTSP